MEDGQKGNIASRWRRNATLKRALDAARRSCFRRWRRRMPSLKRHQASCVESGTNRNRGLILRAGRGAYSLPSARGRFRLRVASVSRKTCRQFRSSKTLGRLDFLGHRAIPAHWRPPREDQDEARPGDSLELETRGFVYVKGEQGARPAVDDS